jgi:hypothetical protein
MRKLVLASAAVLALGIAGPALADDAATAVGGAGGAATGATAGFFIAGPIGAVVGGVIGAGVGAGISNSTIDYARDLREASIAYDGDLKPGYRVGQGVHMYRVPRDDRYSYVYVNNEPALIDNRNNTVVWVGGD